MVISVTMYLMLALLALDLNAIRSEPNLEKRSDLALEYANTALDSARDAISAGDSAKVQAAVAEFRDSVELSWHSLTDTGKYARNNNFFKRAEVRTRAFLRRLDGLHDVAAVEDQPAIEKARARVVEIHDDLIQGIMSKKVKK
jgi:hypothetical protein